MRTLHGLPPNFIVSLLIVPVELVVLVRAVDHANLADVVDEETREGQHIRGPPARKQTYPSFSKSAGSVASGGNASSLMRNILCGE